MGSAFGVTRASTSIAAEFEVLESSIKEGNANWDTLPPKLQVTLPKSFILHYFVPHKSINKKERLDQIVPILKEEAQFETFYKYPKRGNTLAIHYLALLFSHGAGVPHDDVCALRLWKEGSRRGHLDSKYNLALMLHNKRGTEEYENENPYINQFKAVALWTQCAQGGFAKAEQRLAEAHLSGVGVMSANTSLAATHFANATKKSVGDAYVEIGEMHESGIGGFAKDEKAAIDRYIISADSGNHKASFQLGKMYLDGRGVDKDASKGERFIEAAAAAGHTHAQYHLGILHAKTDPFKVGLKTNLFENSTFHFHLL
jgi:TPR repeat protein